MPDAAGTAQKGRLLFILPVEVSELSSDAPVVSARAPLPQFLVVWAVWIGRALQYLHLIEHMPISLEPPPEAP